ncbi:MAG: ABC transporter permease [Clostridia bacterium]|nr:ABC transporter permease [Clostridia bacterium]
MFFLHSVIQKATVLIFGTTGEIVTEKSGHLNLGIPGIMFFGALGGCLGVSICQHFSIENHFLIVLIGCLFAFLFGAILGTIYSFLTVSLRSNQNITGLTITTIGTGCYKMFISFLDGAELAKANVAFNSLFEIKNNFGPMFYISIIVAISASMFLNKTKSGLHLKAVGENPSTADAAGINVAKYKYIATLIGSGIAGLGGLTHVFYLTGASIDIANSAIDHYGWLSIALVIFIMWKPALSVIGAIIFTTLSTATMYIPITGISEIKDLLDMSSYLITVIVLIITSMLDSKENQPPASLGLNYFREER